MFGFRFGNEQPGSARVLFTGSATRHNLRVNPDQ